MAPPHYRSLRDAVSADVSRSIAMTGAGAALFAVVEYVATIASYPGPIGLANAARLAALVATLALCLWLAVTIALAGTLVVASRLLRGLVNSQARQDRGWFAVAELRDGVRPGVPKFWAAVVALTLVGAAVQRCTAYALTHYKEAQLAGIWVAARSVVAVTLAWPAFALLHAAMRACGSALAPALGRANPLGRWRAAGAAVAVLELAAVSAMWFMVPQSRSQLPIRFVVSATAFGIGMGLGALLHARRPRHQRTPARAAALALATLAAMVTTLISWGADLQTKYIAITASPALDNLIGWVRAVTDLDRDGFGSLLGENDCAPLTRAIHPGATDIPDDGIDQNCDGHDFSLKAAPVATGPGRPVPVQFRKPWNLLLITIDTVRYDHTSFGGYAIGPKHRDTTPRLAELVKRSTSFTFCNAPSAGTMASIPAILTSKYFHSGIALDEQLPPGSPPKLLPENTTLPEIMKRGGYRTGVIASHEYWNDWGLDQGVDDYDNSIGKIPDPFRVVADKVTDRAIGWISRHQADKWFLWAHYIDPHGRYVAHPNIVDYGASEPDLYDAELKWTDQQVGRLLDEIQRLPSAANTIIAITSDHGDSMGEHSVPVGTHGTALYRELLHVPMIIYVPDNPPHAIGGATTNLDLVPTLAELAGIDVRDLAFEGKSQVPAVFYGSEDHARIVFAETNAPSPQRAAISEAWKLIYYLRSNIDELYDLSSDSWEHRNLAPTHPPAFAIMKSALDAWLERVMYARSPLFNQTSRRIANVLLETAPRPIVVAHDLTLDHGKIEILGASPVEATGAVPGGHLDLDVYFRVHQRTQVSYRFQLAVWPVGPAWHPTDPTPGGVVRTELRATAEGLFPAERWQANDYVRERFSITIPKTWTTQIAIGLAVSPSGGGYARSTAASPANDPNLMVLGALPLGSSRSPGP